MARPKSYQQDPPTVRPPDQPVERTYETEDTAKPLAPVVVEHPLGVNQDDGSWEHD